MEKSIQKKFQNAVKTHRDSLVDILSNTEEKKNTCLGPCDTTEITNLVEEHDAALERIEQGKFGKCIECKDDVEIDRLELDFTTQVCLGHYTDTQLKVLEQDLELAAKVQRQLLPQELPNLPGFQIAVDTEPAHIVTGDYFDFYTYTDNSQGIAVADVMGKGLPASMLMSKLQAFLRILGPELTTLHTLAKRLNELLRYNLTLIRFISLFLIKLDVKKKEMFYCNAGHNPGIWYKSKTKSIQLLKPTGPAIGLSHSAEYYTDNIKLNFGDLIVIYTDGIIEARDKNNEEFGQYRLEEFIKVNKDKSAKELLSEFKKSFKSHIVSNRDDNTMLIIKVL